MKNKLQRWSNKKLVACVVGPLWDWVHEGDVDLRLRCFRTLGGDVGDVDLPSKTDNAKSVDSLVSKCRCLIVETLMQYAQGSGSAAYKECWKEELAAKLKKKGSPAKVYPRVYPYGPEAAKTQAGFKAVPFTFFATTLACMYTFLAVEKKMWPKVFAEYSYPMTQLWPETQVRRAVHFITTCKGFLDDVLDCYEESGAEYYGDEQEEDEDDDDDEDEDGEDEDGEDEDQLVLSQVDDVF